MAMDQKILEGYKGEKAYIFVSYAHYDSLRVIDIIEKLQQDGYRIWYDDGLEPSKDYNKEIELSIMNCSFFVVFLSNLSISRKFVQNEIICALDNQKDILPVFLEKGVQLPAGLKMRINHIQGIELFRLNRKSFLNKLENSIPDDINVETTIQPKICIIRRIFKWLKKQKIRFHRAVGPWERLVILFEELWRIVVFIILSILAYYVVNKFF